MSDDPNRDLAEQRLNMGKDPGGSYSDLNQKYENQQQNNSGGGGGGGGGACFTRETKILTPEGWKEIGSFKSNDVLLSYTTKSCTLVPRNVLKVKKHAIPSQIWEVKLSCTDEVIRTTKSHTFLTQRGWVKTSGLRSGDTTHYIQKNGNVSIQRVLDVSPSSDYECTFNLVTYQDNNFIVNGIVAHNFTYFRILRSFIVNRLHDVKNFYAYDDLCVKEGETVAI